ncbi:MAG: restriction endonuclease subunit S [Bacteroidota bacterium]|nr:restriction endonuclease subunit S [Bacteroidota bacterium]
MASSYHRPRFKRIFVGRTGIPIFQPAQLNELYPKPTKHISSLTKTDIDALRVRKGQVLLTCSGTVGNVTYVRDTLDNLVFSHDVIRIEPREYGGYIYAYLKSQIGSAIVKANRYGAVIDHIEPEHLDSVPIPDPPNSLKRIIHDLIENSFHLRDQANVLLDEAQDMIQETLRLPDVQEFHTKSSKFNKGTSFQNFSLPLQDLDNRLDGSYHVTVVEAIESHLRDNAHDLVRVDDERISKSVILPGRFARVYVDEDHGVIFLGGKQITELNPNGKKYLSASYHSERIETQLTLRKNMAIITCSGTIGKVNIVPKHWDGWTASQHVIRVVPQNEDVAGYLYAWLSSAYAQPLIARYIYGSTVDEIDAKQVSSILLPLLHSEDEQRAINQRVLEANDKRTEAYRLEQRALTILNEKVIHAR